MRFADLQTFVDVVEAGGMTQAASVKGVSQPGLSRTIRDLENAVRARLLRRTGRGVELTPAGVEFLVFARTCLQQLEDTKRRVREVSGTMPDRLRIAIPPRLGPFIYPVLYRRFMVELPDVVISASEVMTADMAEGINAGRYDLLVSYLPTTPTSGEGKPAFRESLYLAQGKGRSDGDTSPIPLADVAKLPLLLGGRSTVYNRLIESVFVSAGLKLIIAREMDMAEALLAFVSQGEGPSILPYSNFVVEAARGDVVGRLITDPPIERSIFIHASRNLDRHAAGLATTIIHRCLEEIAEKVGWTPIGRGLSVGMPRQ